VPVFDLAFVEFVAVLVMFPFVSANEAMYKKKPTAPPPQTRTSIARIPNTQSQVLEDFFFGCMEYTG
jgi:hypothetical protein